MKHLFLYIKCERLLEFYTCTMSVYFKGIRDDIVHFILLLCSYNVRRSSGYMEVSDFYQRRMTDGHQQIRINNPY